MMSKLYLIPSPLGENEPAEVIPASVLDILGRISSYVVEDARTARRYLSRAGLRGRIDGLSFTELNEHTPPEDVEGMLELFGTGDVGLISEAGLPAVADPGAALVELCHRRGIEVVPLVGPSSLMLALMASGLNGQKFRFHGYLPAKAAQRAAAVKKLESQSASLGETQIFIETPYRNDALLADILSVCNTGTRLCLAADITLPDAFISTRTVGQWKSSGVKIGKRPCVFLILA